MAGDSIPIRTYALALVLSLLILLPINFSSGRVVEVCIPTKQTIDQCQFPPVCRPNRRRSAFYVITVGISQFGLLLS